MAYNAMFDEGTETWQAGDDMVDHAGHENRLPDREYIEWLSDALPFKHQLFKQMNACGFSGSQDDIDQALQFLQKCCHAAGVDILPKTLVSWLKNGKVASTADNRKNIYKLCFALNMNVNQTKEFFLKGVLERPFNYKDLYESVCFFCLNTKRPYADVEQLVAKISNLPKREDADYAENTEQIGNEIAGFTTEEELIDFWINSCASFEKQQQTVTREVKNLLNSCYSIATRYNERFCYEGKPKKVSSPAALLETIYGYGARKTQGGKRIFRRSISKSDFPASIKKNFPQNQQLHDILKGTASHDVLRKALIVLDFFCYFADVKLTEDSESYDPYEHFLMFQDELNDLLQECGYIQLYWRNPFDWMFGRCASSDEPLDMLKDIIAEFYLDKKDIYAN